jgi:hypothetical protein
MGGNVTGNGFSLTLLPSAESGTPALQHGVFDHTIILAAQAKKNGPGLIGFTGDARFESSGLFTFQEGILDLHPGICNACTGGTFWNLSGAHFRALSLGVVKFQANGSAGGFVSSGRIEVASGTLQLVNVLDLRAGATVDVAAGATLEFGGANDLQFATYNHIFAGGSFTGAGLVRLASGNLILSGPSNFATHLVLQGGVVSGSSILNIASKLTLEGGGSEGGGAGNAPTLRSTGEAEKTAAGTFYFGGAATFRNEGIFTHRGGTIDLFPYTNNNNPGVGYFVNAPGAIFRGDSVGVVTVQNGGNNFENSGTVEVTTGTTLEINGVFNQQPGGVSDVASGGVLKFVGGGGSFNILSGGIVRGDGQMWLNSGGLRISGPVNAASGPAPGWLRMTGGVVQGNSTLSIAKATLDGGRLEGDGTVGPVVRLTGPSEKISATDFVIGRRASIQNEAVFTHREGALLLDYFSDGTFLNAAGATFRADRAGTVSVRHTYGGGDIFLNSGLVDVTAGTTLEFVGTYRQQPGGVTEIAAGATLKFAAGAINFAGGVLTGAGQTWLSGGDLWINGPVNAASGPAPGWLRMTGGVVRGNSTLSIAKATLEGGRLEGDGTVGPVVRLTGPSEKISATDFVIGRRASIQNEAVFTHREGALLLDYFSDGTFLNAAGATFRADRAGTVSVRHTYGGGDIFLNSGLVDVTAGTTLEFVGTYRQQPGGVTDIAAGATLKFAAGAINLAGGVLTGAGQTWLNGGDLWINGPVNVASGPAPGWLHVTGGVVRGNSTLSIAKATLEAGAMQGTATIRLTGNESEKNSPGTFYIDASSVVRNEGVFTHRQGQLVPDGVFVNAAGATFRADRAGTVFVTGSYGGGNFLNSGLIQVTTGTTLEVYTSFNQQPGGVTSIANGGLLKFVNDGFFNGGVLMGNGTVQGSFNAGSGTVVSPGQSVGKLAFGSGTATLGIGAFLFELNGPALAQYDQIIVGDGATFALGNGGMALNLAWGALPSIGAIYRLIDATSTGTTTGRFAGLPSSGSNATIGGVTFSIEYHADYVDIVVTAVTATPQTITFGALPAKTFGDEAFTLTATASSGLPVSYASSNSSVATVSGSTVTIVGAGATVITASQPGDGSYAPAMAVPQTLTVNKATATVTLAGLAATYDGTPKAATATTVPGGLAVVFTYDGSSTAPTNAASYTVVATVDDGSYAGTATGTLVIEKASQTITFAALAAKTFGDAPFPLTAVASSGLPVSYASSNPAVATAIGSTVTIVGAGTATITASQSGDTNYVAATPSDQPLTVNKSTATVTLGSLAATYDGTPKPATVTTAPGGLAVVFTYDGSSTVPTNAASYAVIATVNDADYAGTASGTLVIAKASQTITFAPLAAKTVGDAPFPLTATASSGLLVSYGSSNPAVATAIGSTVTIVGSGTTTITASQSGNSNYLAAADVPQGLLVNPATNTSQTITFAALPPKTFGDAPFALTATASSGLPVSYANSNPNVATINGDTVTIVGAGATNITASQPGNATYAAALDVVRTLTVSPASATIALDGLTSHYDGTPKPAIATTNPAGLSVNFIYNGSTSPPIYPGTYAVAARVDNPNYMGTAVGEKVITITALLRRAPVISGVIDGSVQMLNAEPFALGNNAWISGDLLVAGTPTVLLSGSPTYGGTLDGPGVVTPSGHTVTLGGTALLRHVVRRVDPIALPVVGAPPAPTGTRIVSLTAAGQSPGDFATLRNLSLNASAGLVAVPPGTYGNFSASGNSGFVLGVLGATTPAIYNFQSLALNLLPGNAQIQVVGPVVITLGTGSLLNGNIGAPAQPDWLTLRVAAGNVTISGNVKFHGTIVAPNSALTLNGNATLNGNVIANRLTLNGTSMLNDTK